jgi:hypothetical protein
MFVLVGVPKTNTYCMGNIHILLTMAKHSIGNILRKWSGYETSIQKNQQDIDESINKVVVISGVKHKNLVKLKGCCITASSKRLLVYEYVENNDLPQMLFGEFET